MKRWKQRPEGANWGDFGDDDQLGRLNLITAERVRAAAELRVAVEAASPFPLYFAAEPSMGTPMQPSSGSAMTMLASMKSAASCSLLVLSKTLWPDSWKPPVQSSIMFSPSHSSTNTSSVSDVMVMSSTHVESHAPVAEKLSNMNSTVSGTSADAKTRSDSMRHCFLGSSDCFICHFCLFSLSI